MNKPRYLVLIAGVLSTPAFAGVVFPAQDAVWRNAEVDAYVATNHTSRVEAAQVDPFKVPAAPVQPAKSVLLSFAVERANSGVRQNNQATWKYDASTQTLTIETLPDGMPMMRWDYRADPPAGTGRMGGFITERSEVVTNGGTRQNSFGAIINVRTVNTVRRGIVMRSSRSEDPLPAHEGVSYTHILAIEPEAARALVDHLKFQVIATPVQYEPGVWVLCGTRFLAATINNPTEFANEECYLTATVEEVRYVDDRDGSVLRSWPPVR